MLTFSAQAQEEFSPYCFQDNIDECEELGYTETSCPHGGSACPFDSSKWKCIDWQCSDFNFYETSTIIDPDEINQRKQSIDDLVDFFEIK